MICFIGAKTCGKKGNGGQGGNEKMKVSLSFYLFHQKIYIKKNL